MLIKAIDISSENGKVNWQNIPRTRPFDAVFIRCHQLTGIDKEFETNYAACKERHIPVGVYKYAYALNASQARKEAKNVLSVLQGKRFEYPVFYDLEYEPLKALGKEKIDSIAKTFLKQIIKAGYGAAIYCNKDWYDNYISDSLKKHFSFWIASYPYEEDDDGTVQERLNPGNCMIWQYSQNGKIPGFISGDVDFDLIYDGEETAVPEIRVQTPAKKTGPTAYDAISVIKGWLGLNENDGSHKKIIDIYNSHTPLAQGYKLQLSDSWCDATVSAIFITLGATDLIGGTECGVERHIQLFKKKGIWIEDGTITPKPGDIICYNWDQTSQPNDGFADHIGIVENVSGGVITTIEGNASGMVRRCQVDVGDGCIRGFARPTYSDSPTSQVTSGKDTVLFSGKILKKAPVKTWAGDNYPNITSYPELPANKIIDVMDYTQYDDNGTAWYYIRIAGCKFGFVKSSLVAKR